MKPADSVRLLVLSALWGGSFIFMRVAVPALGPVALIFCRVGIAGLALLVYARLLGQPLELRQRWLQYLVIGLLNSALPFVLIATATLRITASLAAILNATTPLFAALIAAAWLREPLTGGKLAGIALGLVGVSVVT
ncbi:MAG: DMT family transporter, partial [Roseiflexaceae bacterium]|nr:DMT family transporter [Roseiflexaceae bacterium]